MKIIKDIPYAPAISVEKPASKRLLDIYLPDNVEPGTPVYINFHGGGLENGSKDDYPAALCEAVAKEGIIAVTANYRMYLNDAKFPDYLYDAAEAVAWCKANLNRYAPEPGKIFVGGESAGAYISMMLCFDKSYLAKHGIDSDTDIGGYIHGSAQPTTHFNVLRERGLNNKRVIVDEAAPLYFIERKTYAPMIILTNENDVPGRKQQNMLVEATMAHLGVTSPYELRIMPAGHCAYAFADKETGVIPLAGIVTEFISKYR